MATAIGARKPANGSPAPVEPQVARPKAASEALRVLLLEDPRGIHDFPGINRIIVSVHVGRTADVACSRGGERHRGRAVHGDVDIIPRGLHSHWVNNDPDVALVLSLAPHVLREVVETTGRDPSRLQIFNRFQVRDAPLEHLAWALQAEMHRGFPCGRVFLEGMAVAVAAQVVHRHSSLGVAASAPRGTMPLRKLRQVLSYIEDQLSTDPSLQEIARVSGLSISHCKALFRRSMGLPVHQYVIRRRVERAALLLRDGRLPISQVALETGFSHQSHLARHMHRVLGVSPGVLRNSQL